MESLIDQDAEKCVLGGLMLRNDAWDEIADRIRATDFANSANRQIFSTIASLVESQSPYDYVTVSERLTSLGQDGQLNYLVRLSMDTPSAANIQAYADIVRDKALARQLAGTAQQISDLVASPGKVREKINDAQALVLSINDSTADSEVSSVKTILKTVVDEIDQKFEGKVMEGLKTPWLDLNQRLGGLRKQDLIIIAGRPSMGKTSFAMNIAQTVAQDGKTVLVFSMETSKEQLTTRMVSSQAKVDISKLLSGQIAEPDWPKITAAIVSIQKMNLFIDDSASLTIMDILARARRLKRKQGLDLIVIDYLQLITGDGENRTQEISGISRGLKRLAKELDVPVIGLSQLNRSLESRADKRPINADLRESGQLEQDADVILGIYRDEVYDADTPDKGLAEIICRKFKNGPIGTECLAFFGEYCRFENTTHRPAPRTKKKKGGFDDY